MVTVTDSAAVAIGGWTVALALPGGETITQTWNATLTQSGASAAAVNLSWNGSLPPGASTTFGFLVVAGEYFAMWQSQTWNGQEAAFRIIMVMLGVLIFVTLPDRDAA